MSIVIRLTGAPKRHPAYYTNHKGCAHARPGQAYLIRNVSVVMPDEKRKFNTSKDDYDKAMATGDPTKITNSDLEALAKEAIKKFKSL